LAPATPDERNVEVPGVSSASARLVGAERLKARMTAMLSEIFILQLELAARRPKEGPPKERYVPFSPNSQFTFKDWPPTRRRLPGALRSTTTKPR